jgi:serine protease Do
VKLFDKLLLLFCAVVSIGSLFIVISDNIVISDSKDIPIKTENTDENQEVATTERIFLNHEANSDINLRPKENFLRRPKIDIPKEIIRPKSSFIGTGFKITDDLWMTARHVLGDCKTSYVNASFESEPEELILIDKVFLHPASDLAIFKYENDAGYFDVPSVASKEATNSLLRTTAFTAGYPVGTPGQLYVKYLGKAALSNVNYDILEPIFVWTVSSKNPDYLTTVAGISGGPLFNSEGKIMGVTVAEQVRRGTISSADLQSINWLIGAVDTDGGSKQPDQDNVNPKNLDDVADKYRADPRIVQLICET